MNDPYRAEYQTERWARTRQRVFARDPLCVACGYRASTVADHKIAAKVWVSLHNGDVNSFYDEANLQGMCVSDHNAKTAKEERHLARVPGVGSIPCK